jgi:hypothetical protein
MRFSVLSTVRLWVLIALPLAAAGCSVMSSDLMEFAADGGCRTSAGTYYLPKTHLRVVVTRTTDDNSVYDTVAVTTIRVPDRHFGYCLDYLGRINTDDIVTVKRYPTTQLLGIISTDAIDQSGAILTNFVKAVIGGVTARTRDGKKTGEAVVVFNADYDPFDKASTAEVNHALGKFGFCLLLDADFAGDWRKINRYCDHPKAGHYDREPYQVQYRDQLPPERRSLQGIFYRPRVPYNYYLFTKDKPRGHGPWQLKESTVVYIENVAPILAARLDRAFFAQRKTTLVFDEGALRNVCVYKTSELEQISLVTLDVVKSVVAIPTQIIQIQIDQTKGEAELAKAEFELLKAQKQYGDILDRGGSEAGPFTPSRPGDNTFHAATAAANTKAYGPIVRPQGGTTVGDLQSLWNGACPTATSSTSTVAAPTFAVSAPNTIGVLAP